MSTYNYVWSRRVQVILTDALYKRCPQRASASTRTSMLAFAHLWRRLFNINDMLCDIGNWLHNLSSIRDSITKIAPRMHDTTSQEGT